MGWYRFWDKVSFSPAADAIPPVVQLTRANFLPVSQCVCMYVRMSAGMDRWIDGLSLKHVYVHVYMYTYMYMCMCPIAFMFMPLFLFRCTCTCIDSLYAHISLCIQLSVFTSACRSTCILTLVFRSMLVLILTCISVCSASHFYINIDANV